MSRIINYLLLFILLLMLGCSEHPAEQVAIKACQALKENDTKTLQGLSMIHLAGNMDKDYLILGKFSDKNSSKIKSIDCNIMRVKTVADGSRIVYIRKMKPLHIKNIEGEWKVVSP